MQIAAWIIETLFLRDWNSKDVPQLQISRFNPAQIRHRVDILYVFRLCISSLD